MNSGIPLKSQLRYNFHGLIFFAEDPLGSLYVKKPITGWWLTYPSEKYESVRMMKFPMESHKIPWFQSTNQIRSTISYES
jgi:hypothetical protein